MMEFVVYNELFLGLSYQWLHDPQIKALTLSPDFTQEDQRRFFDSLSHRTDYKIWGITYNGEPIGAVGLKHIEQTQAEYWGYIGAKEWWGKGLGCYLIEKAATEAQLIGLRSLYLWVGSDNPRAIRLYEKCGFTQTAETYQSGIKMSKNL